MICKLSLWVCRKHSFFQFSAIICIINNHASYGVKLEIVHHVALVFPMESSSFKYVGAFDYTLQVNHLVLVWYIFCESDKNWGSSACESWSKYFYISCLGCCLSCTLRISRQSWCFQIWGSREIGELKEKQVLHSFIMSCGLLCQKFLYLHLDFS